MRFRTRLRDSGPILNTASSHAVTRAATTSDRQQRPTAQVRRNSETVIVWVIFSEHATTGRIRTPSGITPVVTNRHIAMSSLRAGGE